METGTTEPRLSTYLHARACRTGTPLAGNFELTARCNFNCKMCYVHLTAEEQQRRGRELTADQWLAIADQARSRGMLFLLLTMLSDTVYYGLSHDAAKRFTPFEMTYVMFVVGMAVFIPVALIQAGGINSELITAPAQSGSFWLAVLYLGILSSGVAYGLLNFANSHLTVSESSLFSNVTTVVSVLAGVLFLKEDFSLWQALGVVIILVCVFVANVSGGEKK